MSRSPVAAVLTLLLVTAAAGRDAVTIRPPDPPPAGTKTRVTETSKSKSAAEMVFLGQRSATAEECSSSAVYVQEVLTAAAKDGRAPLKLARTYEKYEGTDGGKPLPGPPLDTPIVIEKKGDKYTFDAGAKQLDAAFLDALDKEFNRPDAGKSGADNLPAKPVKVGDTWRIPMPKSAAKPDEMETATAAGKLLRVYRKGGKQHATVETSVSVSSTAAGKDAPQVCDISVSLRGTMDICLDRKDPTGAAALTCKFSMKFEDAGTVCNISTEATATITEELLHK